MLYVYFGEFIDEDEPKVYIGRVKLSNMNIDLDSVGSLRGYNGILQLEPYKRDGHIE